MKTFDLHVEYFDKDGQQVGPTETYAIPAVSWDTAQKTVLRQLTIPEACVRLHVSGDPEGRRNDAEQGTSGTG